MTEYTEEKIREIVTEVCGPKAAADVMAELQKPEVEFAEGEVLEHVGRDGDSQFVVWGQTLWSPAGLNTLTPTEHGPAVQALVNVLDNALSTMTRADCTYGQWRVIREALEAYRSRHRE